jgi:hypothetical protein
MEAWCVLCELGTEFLNIVEFDVLRRRLLASKTTKFQATKFKKPIIYRLSVFVMVFHPF